MAPPVLGPCILGRFGGVRRVAAAAWIGAALAGAALGDEFLKSINATFDATKAEQRSEGTLAPALAKLEPVPASVQAALQPVRLGAALIGTSSPAWADAEAWATGAAQKTAIEAMDKATRETDWRRAPIFAQPYGTDGVPVDMIRAGFYTELGDPPTLAAPKLAGLTKLRDLSTLANIEATRRQAAGDAAGAMKVMADFTLTARQWADRRYEQEVTLALNLVSEGLERVRDIAYTDFRGPRSLDAAALLAVIKRLGEDGPLAIDRIRFPDGNIVAAEQLIARLYGPDGQVDTQALASTMARSGATRFPLRLFSETAQWRGVGASLPDKPSTLAQVKKLRDDWTLRWPLSAFDPQMSAVWEYSQMDRSRFMLVAQTVPDLTSLFEQRQALRAEAVGTRQALSVYGFFRGGGAMPPDITSIRPRFVKEVEADPFNPNRARGAQPAMHMFVPIRDTKDQFPGRAPEPSTLAIVIPGLTSFESRVGEDQFVLYSVGGDGGRNWARRVENARGNIPNADYLIWPPVTSLYRQHLIDTGAIK